MDEEFKANVRRSLNLVNAKISFLKEGVEGLGDAFKDLDQDLTEYMDYTTNELTNHRKRLDAIEKHLNL